LFDDAETKLIPDVAKDINNWYKYDDWCYIYRGFSAFYHLCYM